MNILDAFKSEIFRPLAILFVPGSIAIAPYIIIVGHHIPKVQTFWDDHSTAFVAIIIVCCTAVGLILENIGSEIEVCCWDKCLGKKDTCHNTNWTDYRKLETNDEIVGQRYLRTILTRMKFELSMIPALFSFLVGLIWLNHIFSVWTCWRFFFLLIFFLILIIYLIWSSYNGACILAETRKLIIDAVKARENKVSAKNSNSNTYHFLIEFKSKPNNKGS